jgi:hypothetical protein
MDEFNSGVWIINSFVICYIFALIADPSRTHLFHINAGSINLLKGFKARSTAKSNILPLWDLSQGQDLPDVPPLGLRIAAFLSHN